MEAKKRLAEALVRRYHGSEAAERARKEFESVVQKKETPIQTKLVSVRGEKIALIDLVAKAQSVTSRGEARRLIEQGGVAYGGRVITDFRQRVEVQDGDMLRIGKRRFFRIQKAK
jgi:tyrosyl-tRNA synthetase